MAALPLIAGIELGGTKVVCLLARGPDDVVDEVRIDTTTPEATLDAVSRQLMAWRRTHGFDALGFGSFGPLEVDPNSADYGFIVGTPKRGWDRVDLLSVGRSFDVPVGFDTDVNGAALAEGRWGAARGLANFIYITVGTGIGVGTIVAGRSIRGLAHSEAGHLRVLRRAGETFPGACPFHGDCAEGLAAGPAIEARAGARGETLPADHPAWDETVHALAGLCHNLIYTAAPERILLGGGVPMGQPHLLPRIRGALSESLAGYAAGGRVSREIETFLIRPALGGRAGPLGAIALGLDALNSAA